MKAALTIVIAGMMLGSAFGQQASRPDSAKDVRHVADEIRRMATMESHRERKAALAWMLMQPRTLLRQAFPRSHR